MSQTEIMSRVIMGGAGIAGSILGVIVARKQGGSEMIYSVIGGAIMTIGTIIVMKQQGLLEDGSN